MTNTTNMQYSIVGLIPNTSYTIAVRAYTIVLDQDNGLILLIKHL